MNEAQTKKIMSRSLLLAVLAALVGLGGILPACAQGGEATAEEGMDASTPVAEVAGQTITQGELEESAAEQLQRMEDYYAKQLKDQKKKVLDQQLDQLIEERLLATEAENRGVSEDELVEQEVGEVSDADIDAFFEENQERIRGTREQMGEQIRQFLAQQKRQEFVASLREKYNVRILVEPDRVDVEVAGAPTKGPDDAPVTIVEFSDFECPYCSRVTPTLDKVMEEYEGKVRLAFRQFPLSNIHPNAQKAAEASLCAHEQGEFWAMHDAMFADQRNLGVDALKTKAGELGLDAEEFAQCLDSDKYADEVSADMQAGQAAGVSGTPAMFINGRFISGAVPFEQVAEVIDDELQRHNQGE